jgi:predicted ATPase
MHRFILTGTPGSGKTTLINALAAQGHSVVREAATDVIALENTNGVREPWRDAGFIDKIAALQAARQMESARESADAQFHDRSPICTYALSDYLGFAPSAALIGEVARIDRDGVFEKRVFFVENLGFIEPTEARKISFEESLVFERVHRETYRRFGYELISIPAALASERVRLILAAVKP